MAIFLKDEVEYYREQYQKLITEYETLRDRVNELGEEVKSAKVCICVYCM